MTVLKIREILTEQVSKEEKKILQYRKDNTDQFLLKYFPLLFLFYLVTIPLTGLGQFTFLQKSLLSLLLAGTLVSFFSSRVGLIRKYARDIIFVHSLLVLVALYCCVIDRGDYTLENIFALTGFFAILIFIQSYRLRSWSSLLVYLPGTGMHNYLLFAGGADARTFYQTNLILGVALLLAESIIINRKEKAIESIHLNRERWLIDNDLKIARAVQDSLFPKAVDFPGKFKYEVYRQAQIQIGGDFFDFIQLREGNLGIFFTDVAGHGISASMVAAILKVVVSTIPYKMKLDPEKLLGFIDTVMERDLNHYHASAVYMFMNFIERKIYLGNAGHPYVIHSEKNGSFTAIQTEGALMGFGIKKPLVTVKELPMISGDRYFIYTDGIIESENEADETLGDEGILEILNRHQHTEDLAVLKNEILADLKTFFGKKSFADDAMFLILEIL